MGLTGQNPEWKFPCDVHVRVLCPRMFPKAQSEVVEMWKLNLHFPLGNFVWEFWTTFQEIPFSLEICRFRRLFFLGGGGGGETN